MLFTTYNCLACGAHQQEVMKFAKTHKIPLQVRNVDDPKNFSQVLASMRKYRLRINPAIVVLDDAGEVIEVVNGIKHSIGTLTRIVNESNH